MRRLGLVVVLLAAVGALVVWQLGGFEARKDYVLSQPGEVIDAGNLVFTLTDATAQKKQFGGWEVVVNGTVSNPNDEALAPATGNSGNLAVSTGTGGSTAVLASFELGGTWRRSVVAPGGRPVALAAVFDYPDGVTFGDTIHCGVFSMQYTDNTVLGVSNGAKDWNQSADRGHTLTLPLTILPPEE